MRMNRMYDDEHEQGHKHCGGVMEWFERNYSTHFGAYHYLHWKTTLFVE